MARNLFINTTIPGIVKTGACVLSSMYVNSSTSGTMAIYDAQAATAAYAIGGTMTPAVGFHFLGNLTCTQGVYVDLSNLNITLHFLDVD